MLLTISVQTTLCMQFLYVSVCLSRRDRDRSQYARPGLCVSFAPCTRNWHIPFFIVAKLKTPFWMLFYMSGQEISLTGLEQACPMNTRERENERMVY